MDNDLGKLAFGDFNFETQELRMKDITTAKQAAEALQDPYTDFVWLYPDHSGDPSSVKNVTSVGEVHEHGCMEADDHIMIAAHNFQMRKL